MLVNPRGAQHTPPCDVHYDNVSLSNVAGNSALLDAGAGIVGLEPRHHGGVPSDACATARTPLSNVAGNSTLLDADVGIVGLVPEHPWQVSLDACAVSREPLDEGCVICTSSPNVGWDIGSDLEQVKIDEDINLGDTAVPNSLRCSVSMQRRQRR